MLMFQVNSGVGVFFFDVLGKHVVFRDVLDEGLGTLVHLL